MTSVVVSSPYVAQGNTLKRLMIQVIIALLPGTLAYAWYFGPGVIVNIVLATLFALVFEAAKQPVATRRDYFSSGLDEFLAAYRE